MWRFAFVVPLLLGGAASAVADTVMTLDLGTERAPFPATIYLRGELYRYETARAFSLFNPALGVIYDVSPDRKRYTRITQERLRDAARQFDSGRQDRASRLAAMSPARRDAITAYFGPPDVTAASELQFRTTSYTATFGQWHCQILHVMLGDVQHGTVCVVPVAELRLDVRDLPALRLLTRFMSQGPHPFAGIASFWDLDAIEKTAGRAAFPVHTIMASPSGWEDVAVRGIETRPAPAGTFDLPDGLTEEDMPPR